MSSGLETTRVSDRTLAREAQAGSRDAFGELVERHQGPLFHFLQVRTGSAADAEELTQESFLRAWKYLDRYDARYSFSTWLFTVARRLAIGRMRRTRPMESAHGLVSESPLTVA